MKIVVTGAAGFIGSHACERLVAGGHDVVGVDSFDSYLYPASVKRRNAAELAGLERFRLVEANITDRAAMASLIDERVDVVCHLAALAGVRPSLAEPLRYLDANVIGTGVVLERMRELGKTRLVFASSSSVYGARPGAIEPFREDDPCLTPASPYAATKRMNELHCSTYRDLFGLGVIALRFFTVYGPRQRPDMAIPGFVERISREQPITLFGDGSSRRDYTYIDDIVSGLVAAIERVVPGQFDIINLGGSATISLAELVAIIERTVGKRAIVEHRPDQPGDVPITFASIDKAKALLGYTPTTTPEAGIAQYWAWITSRP